MHETENIENEHKTIHKVFLEEKGSRLRPSGPAYLKEDLNECAIDVSAAIFLSVLACDDCLTCASTIRPITCV